MKRQPMTGFMNKTLKNLELLVQKETKFATLEVLLKIKNNLQ